jgi:hypothetical protein
MNIASFIIYLVLGLSLCTLLLSLTLWFLG